MQTFAPEGTRLELGFSRLDRQRLGKQRVEAWQILMIVSHVNPESQWRNHPAVLMWMDEPAALAHYGALCCEEWIDRGYKDSLHPKFVYVREIWLNLDYDDTPPIFLNRIMESHRSNLIRKDPRHYQPIWPGVRSDLPYVWPERKRRS